MTCDGAKRHGSMALPRLYTTGGSGGATWDVRPGDGLRRDRAEDHHDRRDLREVASLAIQALHRQNCAVTPTTIYSFKNIKTSKSFPKRNAVSPGVNISYGSIFEKGCPN
jgi:hypothetical protein